MGKWKSKLKHKTNRRGGEHYFELSTKLKKLGRNIFWKLWKCTKK